MEALALVIGNSNYPGNELKNPANDAEDFADVLERLGFKVEVKIDIDQQGLNNAIDAFGKALDQYDIGLFYFAGHGVQIDGENFLTVVNTNFDSETSVQYSSVTLNKILSLMERADNKTNIIILDACRDNPYEKTWHRSLGKAGLAPMYAPKGTLIGYATSPGERAKDGIGRNGLYTTALLKHIRDEHISIEELFKRVRNSVFAFSNGKQTSWEHTSLTGNFVFNSGQLIHAVDTPYSTQAIKDKEAELDKRNELDKIILELKSHNWYIQNPAITKAMKLTAPGHNQNKLFLLGRNILQSATGGSNEAISSMENLESWISQFTDNGDNHVLNGILFEMYFNSEGVFRKHRVKDDFIGVISHLNPKGEFEKSFKFIKAQLAKFSTHFFYIPGDEIKSVSFDVVFDKQSNKEEDEFYVKSILFEGEELLKPYERNSFFGDDEGVYFEPILYSALKNKIANLSGVPISMITVNSNFDLTPDSKVRFPLGHTIRRTE